MIIVAHVFVHSGNQNLNESNVILKLVLAKNSAPTELFLNQ
jgi:hypothetical protein